MNEFKEVKPVSNPEIINYFRIRPYFFILS